MTTLDTTRAERIARAGAAKMTGQGYTFKAASTLGHYWVIKPGGDGQEQEGKYLTSGVTTFCDCPFGKENSICKHGLWLAEELAWEAAVEARCAELEEAELARYDLVDAKY